MEIVEYHSINAGARIMLRYRFLPAIVVAALLVAGPLISGRVVPPIVGIGTFLSAGALGLILGLTLIGTGLFGLVRRREWATRMLGAGVLPLLGALVIVGLFVLRPGPAHRFNDVTTDLADPPSFSQGPAAGQPYPDAYRDLHSEAYPDLKPTHFGVAPEQVFDAALTIAKATDGWEVVHEDRASGVIQVLARTSIFRFEDDVVVRIRADESGSIVDLRSKSRIGQGDRGANADRIRGFLTRLSQKLARSG